MEDALTTQEHEAVPSLTPHVSSDLGTVVASKLSGLLVTAMQVLQKCPVEIHEEDMGHGRVSQWQCVSLQSLRMHWESFGLGFRVVRVWVFRALRA